MKITYIGLSCFLIESSNGSRVLLDPYNDQPEYCLGLKFPKEIEADVFLVSHPDEDHSYLRREFIRKKRPSDERDTNSDIEGFEDFNLKGTLVREYNGDINIAYSFMLDGLRFTHLADNAHVLSEEQLDEFGQIDILITPTTKGDDDIFIQNIKLLKPSYVIPSHFIPYSGKEDTPHKDVVSKFIKKLVLQEWITNKNANEYTVNVLSNIFIKAFDLQEHFPNFHQSWTPATEIDAGQVEVKETEVILFRDCLGLHEV